VCVCVGGGGGGGTLWEVTSSSSNVNPASVLTSLNASALKRNGFRV
jgi:hypothetical protein